MTVFVCESVNDNCWNFYNSYGEICVHCGCCSKDKETRYKSRIEVLKSRIEELESFDRWSENESLREIQEKNIAFDIESFKNQIKYCERKLKEVSE